MNSTIYSKTRLLFKNEGQEGASAELQVPPTTTLNIMWEGKSSEPQFTGDDFFVNNSLFAAAFFDYLIHKKAQQKAAAEDILPEWEETADEEHANFQDDSAAEKTYEEKLANLRKDTKKAEETLLELAALLAFGPKKGSLHNAYCSACIEFTQHQGGLFIRGNNHQLDNGPTSSKKLRINHHKYSQSQTGETVAPQAYNRP